MLLIHTHVTVDCNSFLFSPYILSFDLCIIISLAYISFFQVCALLNKWDSTVCSACICCDLLTTCALNKWGGDIINNSCLLSPRRAAVICLGNSIKFVRDKILHSRVHSQSRYWKGTGRRWCERSEEVSTCTSKLCFWPTNKIMSWPIIKIALGPSLFRNVK